MAEREATPRAAYGGQAVIEGVMIRGKERVATAVRLADGSITVRREVDNPIMQRHRLLRLAFFRGMPALIDSLRLGYRTLMWSADLAMESEGQKKPTALQYALTIAGALAFGIGLFVLLPTWGLTFIFHGAEEIARDQSIAEQLSFSWARFGYNLAEGVLRVLMLVGYVVIIARNKEIKRVFAYHGAEHKVVNAWEAGADLSVQGARPFSRIHPRCGTSFLFLVFVVGILMHAAVGWPEAWLRVVTRLLMLPIIAGIAYELIRLAGRKRDSLILRILVWPGMALQRLTTAEPEDDQIEVAVHSMRTVLEDEGVLAPAEEPVPGPPLPQPGTA